MITLSVNEQLLQEALLRIHDKPEQYVSRGTRAPSGHGLRLRRRNRHTRSSTISSTTSKQCSVDFVNHRDFGRFQPSSSTVQNKKSLLDISPADLPPLPFNNFDESSDCISVNSDQAVLVDTGLRQVLPAGHLNASCSMQSQDEGDLFDSNNMPAPSAKNGNFHPISQPVAIPSYILGQEGHRRDMSIESTPRSAQLAVSLLNIHDAAFVRRSDGRWCYSILAEKVLLSDEDDQYQLRFVVDGNGSTKTISFHKWGECVRMVK